MKVNVRVHSLQCCLCLCCAANHHVSSSGALLIGNTYVRGDQGIYRCSAYNAFLDRSVPLPGLVRLAVAGTYSHLRIW